MGVDFDSFFLLFILGKHFVSFQHLQISKLLFFFFLLEIGTRIKGRVKKNHRDGDREKEIASSAKVAEEIRQISRGFCRREIAPRH